MRLCLCLVCVAHRMVSEAPASERVELFRKKLQACCYVYDFKQPDAYMKEKEAKRQTLLEIVE